MYYGKVKELLAKQHNISPENMTAFTGRLRVLRKLGIPITSPVGSGRHLKFNDNDVIEIHLALLLDEIGIAPVFIASVVKEYRRINHPRSKYLIIFIHANCGVAQNPSIHVSIVGTSDLIDMKYMGNDTRVILSLGTSNDAQTSKLAAASAPPEMPALRVDRRQARG